MLVLVFVFALGTSPRKIKDLLTIVGCMIVGAVCGAFLGNYIAKVMCCPDAAGAIMVRFTYLIGILTSSYRIVTNFRAKSASSALAE
jgi:hypothetical protein